MEGKSRLLIGDLHLSPSRRNAYEQCLGSGVDGIKRRIVDGERAARVQPKMVVEKIALAILLALRERTDLIGELLEKCYSAQHGRSS